MFKSFDEIISEVKKNQKKQKVAVVGADKDIAIEAAADIVAENLGEPVLFGPKEKIEKLWKGTVLENKVEVVDCFDAEMCCTRAVDYAVEGKVHLILKGTVETAMLMKAIFRKENGLKDSPVVSDVLVFEDPLGAENKRLIGLTDGGLIPLPDLETKIEMTRSAVKVFHKLGFEKPKVAYISAVEKVSPKIQSTVDAAEIQKRKAAGELEDINAYLEGPYAIDNVISEYAAKVKGIESVMAGSADILVMPNIESGNVLGKIANYWGNAANGHVITGAKVPVLITSRADDAKTKLNSVALGILVSF
ncbi:MAG TPA: phosphate acyltransferase [bacterium]|nr:phosphate acyltransferase [bacterium]HOG44404.1 phosphate acyltransferase [bacterium]